MIKARSVSDKIFDCFVYFIVALGCLSVLLPLIYILANSLSSPKDVALGNVLFWPKNFTLDIYQYVLENDSIGISYLWSIIYTVLGTLISISLIFLSAYPLSRRDLKGRGVFMFIYVFTMYVNGGLIPTFIVVQALGLYNTIWGVILPGCMGIWNIIVVRTYMSTAIPWDLQEAAMLDGADAFRIFIRIILPLCRPIFAIQILFMAVGYWNMWFKPLIYLVGEDRHPLQLILRKMLIQNDMDNIMAGGVGSFTGAEELLYMSEALKYATIVVATLPILLVYPFLQKFFEKGMVVGSLKG